MIIRELKIDGFGKFNSAEFIFDEKLNVISGKNEAGKSTLHAFIRAMLFGLDTRKKGTVPSEYEKLRPWNKNSAYGGSMRVGLDGKNYLIKRDFNKSAFDISVICETTAEKIEDTDQFIDRLTKGLSKTAFENTVSIGQLGLATGKTMTSELKNYMSNMETTANPALNADDAVKFLDEEKNTITSKIDIDAEKEYLKTLTQIKRLEKEISEPLYENRIVTVSRKKGEIEKEVAKLTDLRIKTEEDIRSYEKILLSKNLPTDKEAIKSTKNSLVQLYREYERMEKKVRGKAKYVFAILFAVLFAASLAFGILNRGTQLFLIFIIAAAVFAIISAVIFAVMSGNKNTFTRLQFELNILIERHTGRKDISRENIERLFNAFDNYGKICGDIENAKRTISDTERRTRQIIREQTECLDDLNTQYDIQLQLEQKIADINELKRKAAILKNVLKANDEIREKLDAIDLAKETLSDLAETVRSSIGSVINREAGKMIQGVTAGKYTGIDAGRDFDIYLNSDNDLVPLYALSAGTIDQTYLAIRIAAVRAMTDINDELPLILDDSFALYDDERLRKAVMFVSGSYKGQIIIFTCHNREEPALIEKNLPFRKIVMERIN